MEGQASWSQINFFAIAIISVFGFAFFLAWVIQELRKKDRHEQRSVFQQEITSLHDKIELISDAFDERLKAMELSSAGTIVVLEHMKEFQKEVRDKFQELRRERGEDMRRIHQSLAGIYNRTNELKVIESSNGNA